MSKLRQTVIGIAKHPTKSVWIPSRYMGGMWPKGIPKARITSNLAEPSTEAKKILEKK